MPPEPVGNFTWAKLNPFARADRGQLGQETTPTPQNLDNTPDPNLQLKDDEELVPDPKDSTKQIKRKKGSDDPLLQFDSLWQPNKDADGKDIVDDHTPQAFLPKLDNKKLGEMVNKMNFTGDITPEQTEAIKAGGEGATQAMLQIMNGAARKAFTVSLAAASRMAEQGFSTAQARFAGEIPGHVRDMMTENELSGSVTIMNNPAFAPLVQSVKQQYLSKFPKASPRDVNTAVKQYFDHMAKELTKKPDSPDSRNTNQSKLRAGDPGADFMEWIEKDLVRGNSSSPFSNRDVTDETQQ